MKASFRRMRAISRKEYMHIRRDPRMLFAVLGMPIIQLLLFAYAISFDVTDVPTILLDGDRTMASREYLAAYEQSDFFDVIGHVDSMDAIDDSFDRSQARIAVMVAPGFGSSHRSGRDRAASRCWSTAPSPTRHNSGRPMRPHSTSSWTETCSSIGPSDPGPRHGRLWRHSAADPHLVQPRTALSRLPHTRPDGRHHHDRHDPADGRNAREGEGPGDVRAGHRVPRQARRAHARQGLALGGARLRRHDRDHARCDHGLRHAPSRAT